MASKRRATPEQPDAKRPVLGVQYQDQTTLRFRHFWSPGPTWVYTVVPTLGFFLIVAGVSLASGSDSDGALTAGLFGAIAGYFVGAFGWAIIGPLGGDVLRVTFDRREGAGEVYQSLFWTWKQEWDFELDELASIEMIEKRGRFIMRVVPTYFISLHFKDEDVLRLGKYGSYREARDAAYPLRDFLKLRLTEPDRAR